MSYSYPPGVTTNTSVLTSSETARYNLYAVWEIRFQNTSKYYGAAIAALVVVFAIAHWTRIALANFWSKNSLSFRISKSLAAPKRRLDTAFAAAHSPLSPGQTVLVLTFIGINVALTFYDRPQDAGLLSIMARRFGWMALCNLCVTVFLALKNTPLSPLAGRSFDSLNVLHRCCGYTTILYMVLHAIVYQFGLVQISSLVSVMSRYHQIMGAVAGVSMLVIFVTSIWFIRRRQYEIFYITHVVLVALILVSIGLHRSSFVIGELIVTVLAASMWFSDHVIRFSRWIYWGVGNYCIITPLSDQATKVTMYRSIQAQPGSMAFLWIPGVRMLERHPHTLMSAEPATFVIKAQDGFTRDLYDAACKEPGRKMRASIEGPYCTVPDTHQYDKVIVFAGGSGVTFANAVAIDWVRRQKAESTSTLGFVWTVRHESNLTWLNSELSELAAHPRVDVSLYVTNPKAEKKAGSDVSRSTSHDQGVHDFNSGRPDVKRIVEASLSTVAEDGDVLIAACGPDGLVMNVRRAVGECTSTKAPNIKLHLEQFSF